MTMVATNLLNTRESARQIRVEPTNAIGGLISQTNIQRALEQIAGYIVGSSTTITTTPATILPSVRLVYFNVGSAASATLPDAATWDAANPGGELLLKDISGNATTNNITINRAGSNTIDAMTSIQITGNYGAYSLRVTGGNWTIVNMG